MAFESIGEILFVGILQMDPTVLTGNIINDLVMFFFLPTVIILIVVYIVSGHLLGRGSKLSFLLAVALYLFIIFGGFYPFFAGLAKSYFIFLIFILGALLFLGMHFRVGREKPGPEDTRASELTAGAATSHAQAAADLLNSIESQCGVVRATMAGPDQRLLPDQLRDLGNEIAEFQRMKKNMKYNFAQRTAYGLQVQRFGLDESRVIEEARKLLKRRK